MTDEITDKEIREVTLRHSVGCPNCHGLLSLMVTDRLSSSDRAAIIRLIENGDLELASVEEAAEISMQDNRNGSLSWVDNQ